MGLHPRFPLLTRQDSNVVPRHLRGWDRCAALASSKCYSNIADAGDSLAFAQMLWAVSIAPYVLWAGGAGHRISLFGLVAIEFSLIERTAQRTLHTVLLVSLSRIGVSKSVFDISQSFMSSSKRWTVLKELVQAYDGLKVPLRLVRPLIPQSEGLARKVSYPTRDPLMDAERVCTRMGESATSKEECTPCGSHHGYPADTRGSVVGSHQGVDQEVDGKKMQLSRMFDTLVNQNIDLIFCLCIALAVLDP